MTFYSLENLWEEHFSPIKVQAATFYEIPIILETIYFAVIQIRWLFG